MPSFFANLSVIVLGLDGVVYANEINLVAHINNLLVLILTLGIPLKDIIHELIELNSYLNVRITVGVLIVGVGRIYVLAELLHILLGKQKIICLSYCEYYEDLLNVSLSLSPYLILSYDNVSIAYTGSILKVIIKVTLELLVVRNLGGGVIGSGGEVVSVILHKSVINGLDSLVRGDSYLGILLHSSPDSLSEIVLDLVVVLVKKSIVYVVLILGLNGILLYGFIELNYTCIKSFLSGLLCSLCIGKSLLVILKRLLSRLDSGLLSFGSSYTLVNRSVSLIKSGLRGLYVLLCLCGLALSIGICGLKLVESLYSSLLALKGRKSILSNA